MKKKILNFLIDTADWICYQEVGSGILRHTEDTPDSIFINSNLSRTLLCAFDLTGRNEYLSEALGYCRSLLELARPIKTSKASPAYWWMDTIADGHLYLADTGTAMTFLCRIFPYLDQTEKSEVLGKLEGFYRLVTEGTDHDPTGENIGSSPGWVLGDGALGVGFYKGLLECRPYTVSTAQAGALFGALMYNLTGEEKYKRLSIGAMNWLLSHITSEGTIEYHIRGAVEPAHRFQAIHYSVEAMFGCYVFVAELGSSIAGRVPAMVKFALENRNQAGLWGEDDSYDQERSFFLFQLLNWHQRHIGSTQEIGEATEKILNYLLGKDNTTRYGIKRLVRQTGFVGLAMADYLQEGIALSWPDRE